MLFRFPLRKISNSYFKLGIVRQCNTRSAIKEKSTNLESTEQTQSDYEPIIVSTKIKKKLPQREPLLKNFFCANVDRELIPFPEVISRDDIASLYKEIKPAESYFNETLDMKTIERTRNIPRDVFDQIRELGLFGSNIPQHLGGKGYLISESLLAADHERNSVDIALVLSSHRIIADVLNELGTEDQKNRFLPKMSNGTLMATEAVFEKNTTGNRFFGTKAIYDSVKKEWILNGSKSFIINGTHANLFLVLAQTSCLNTAGDMADGVTMFLVDANQEGVQKSGPLFTFGFRGDQQGTLTLTNVKVKEENVIGDSTKSNDFAKILLRYNRLRTSWLASGIMKQIVDYLTEHSISTQPGGIALSDTELIKIRLAKLMATAYACESSVYFTSGLMDEFENQDLDLELAALKSYSIQNLWKISTIALNYLGPKALISEEPLEVYLRNAAQIYAQGESIDNLNLFIGLCGLQHCGSKYFEVVKKERNPLFHPKHIFRHFFDTRSFEKPKLTLNLYEDLHPSLMPAANWLEESIIRLQMGCEMALSRHGSEIFEKQSDIMRISESASLIYAMFSSISRSSRSYCIGIRHSDYEMLLASVICYDGMEQIKTLMNEIVKGEYLSNDKNYKKIAKQILNSKGYFCDHPLRYNY